MRCAGNSPLTALVGGLLALSCSATLPGTSPAAQSRSTSGNGDDTTAPEIAEPQAPAPIAEEAEDPEPEADGHQNTIRWSTASEVDNFGFDVYRGEDSEGPFERLNPEVIEGGGTSDEPRHYEYVDDSIDPTKTYYYYVESISMAGVRERFTPVGRAGPKLPAPEGDE